MLKDDRLGSACLKKYRILSAGQTQADPIDRK